MTTFYLSLASVSKQTANYSKIVHVCGFNYLQLYKNLRHGKSPNEKYPNKPDDHLGNQVWLALFSSFYLKKYLFIRIFFRSAIYRSAKHINLKK